ncbi:MAG: Cytoplasmic thioredoxin isoenzyme 2 [Peltula sp. TS41687]|nr:MAG: Cytoplasmic thioredoxin isoenzyme 2 [Peltula sp. TS41687]
MGVHNIQSLQEFKEKVIDETQALVVVDCFATWCGPCKVIAPTIVTFSEQHPQAKFYKIDVDEVSDVAKELGVTAMPTFYFFKNGTQIEKVIGANPTAIQQAIQTHINP